MRPSHPTLHPAFDESSAGVHACHNAAAITRGVRRVNLPRPGRNTPARLTLGATEQYGPVLAFLVRPDGAVAVHRPRVAFAEPAWTPMPLALVPVGVSDGTAADRLEVRLSATTATFLVNGPTAAAIPFAPGEIDGSPGVHVGAGGDVLVTLFTVESAESVFRKKLSDAR